MNTPDQYSGYNNKDLARKGISFSDTGKDEWTKLAIVVLKLLRRDDLKHDDFDLWLRNFYVTRDGCRMDDSTRVSRTANCRTVEKYEGDLDEHFEKDEFKGLLTLLAYSTADERQNSRAKHRIPINGNVRNGSSTLKSAVGLYQQFREYIKKNGTVFTPFDQINKVSHQKPKSHIKRSASLWPEWPLPKEDTLLTLAKELTPFVRFLHPDIVAAVVEDNESRRQNWACQLRDSGIDPDIYLWEKSPCAFPGVRRYAGSKEIAKFRGHTGSKTDQSEQALSLDDNDFPKHLWSFIFRGKQFQKFGPDGYALAHLADHKTHNNRWAEEFETSNTDKVPQFFYGFYTSAANTVYVPTNFLKPTDFNDTIRTMLQRKAEDLYGAFCNIAPPPLRVRSSASFEWEIDNFIWGEPVGTTENINEFLNYRERVIDGLLTVSRSEIILK